MSSQSSSSQGSETFSHEALAREKLPESQHANSPEQNDQAHDALLEDETQEYFSQDKAVDELRSSPKVRTDYMSSSSSEDEHANRRSQLENVLPRATTLPMNQVYGNMHGILSLQCSMESIQFEPIVFMRKRFSQHDMRSLKSRNN